MIRHNGKLIVFGTTCIFIQCVILGVMISYTSIKSDVDDKNLEVFFKGLSPGRERHDPTILVDDKIARDVSKKIRLLCWVTTELKHFYTKAKAVNSTWGGRCDKFLIILTKQNSSPSLDKAYSNVIMVDNPDGREHLTAKSKDMFTYLYSNYLRQFDWFLKADDDSYVIVENLKYFLSLHNVSKPLATGRYFIKYGYNGTGYMSGGAGYVMNRLALKNMVEKGFNGKKICRRDGGSEDVEIGICLARTGTHIVKSIDKYGRQTFSPNSIMRFVVEDVPEYLYTFDRHKVLKGKQCCSQLSISFHYIDPRFMMVLDFILYRTTVYGYVQDTDALNNLLKPELEERTVIRNSRASS